MYVSISETIKIIFVDPNNYLCQREYAEDAIRDTFWQDMIEAHSPLCCFPLYVTQSPGKLLYHQHPSRQDS